jgi:hypothetical protein
VGEFFRNVAGTTANNLPFCTLHSGAEGEGVNPAMGILNLPALDAVPIRPKEPVLIGDDPYHTEVPSFVATSAESGTIRHRTSVQDSLDLGNVEESIPLKSPQRLLIEEE